MATAKNILKNWFRNKLKPTQEQFWAWMESYWHKDEKIPVSSISGLENLLNGTATVEQLKLLQQKIVAINKTLNSDDVSLNDLQKVINFIKQNRKKLNELKISNITGLEETLLRIDIKIEALKKIGFKDGKTISLTANTPQEYTLPNRSLLYAIELKGKATVKIGTASGLSDLGEITGNAGAVSQLGLLSANEIWLQGNAEVELVPIIYRR